MTDSTADKEGFTTHCHNSMCKMCADHAHQHQYTVPVEWTELTQNMTRRPYGYKVTKLRCACGNEVER